MIGVSYKGNYYNAGSRKVRRLSKLHVPQLPVLWAHCSHNHPSTCPLVLAATCFRASYHTLPNYFPSVCSRKRSSQLYFPS